MAGKSKTTNEDEYVKRDDLEGILSEALNRPGGIKLLSSLAATAVADILKPESVALSLKLVSELAMINATIPGATYHVVVIPDSGDHVRKSFTTPSEAAAFIKTYNNQDVHVRVFYGRELAITKGPGRFLLTHEGRFPLFEQEGDSDIDETGSLANPYAALVVPKPVDVDDEDEDEGSPSSTEEYDDGDDEDDDEN